MRTCLAVGPFAAEATARDVDDRGIDAPYLVEVDAELGPCLGQVVGEEDIAATDEFLEDRSRLVERKREADAALAAVGRLDRGCERHPRCGSGPSLNADQSALRISGHRVLDLDDVGTPVSEHRTCGGHESELGDFEDAHTGHRLLHLAPHPFWLPG